MDDTKNKIAVALTRDALNKAGNSVKARFMPRTGSSLRLPNGVVYKVVFSNVGQLRFTALFDCVVDMKALGVQGMANPYPTNPYPEELTTS
jgi:hypothetical protein